IVPANLLEKTEREFRALEHHWRKPPPFRLVSYEWLGRKQAAKSLEDYAPDLIVTDESHKLKNKQSAVVRRVVRYMKAHPDTRFVALTGTISRKSLKEYGHLLQWCLGDGSPLPLSPLELDTWAGALDEMPDSGWRVGPGVLLDLCETRSEDLHTVRRGYQTRLLDTPGVVTAREEPLAIPLEIRPWLPREDPQIDT